MRLIVMSVRDERQHRAAQRLGATDLAIGLQFGHRLGDELDGGIRIDRPVRN
jgi:hypothetical protein